MLHPVRVVWAAAIILLLLLPAASAYQRKKEKKEEITQTLEIPPDPPATISAETARLTFAQTPLISKGLLSQQTRDALKALLSTSRGAQFIRIRAFVAGTGDLRRVQTIVSEVFSEKHLPLPVLSVVQVGALPLVGAQVQLEATLQDKKPINPAGLVFAVAEAPDPRLALEQLRDSLSAAGASGLPLRLVCSVSVPEMIQTLRDSSASVFPSSPLVALQSQRIAAQAGAACEAISRLGAPVPDGTRFLPGAVAVSATRLIFAGSQLAFRYQESDARLAFQRLEKTLQAASTSLKRCVFLNSYPLSPQIAAMIRRVRSEFLDPARPPAGGSIPFEGLPSLDAAFALEAIVLAGPGS